MRHAQEAKNALKQAVALADEIEHGSLRWIARYYLSKAGDKEARKQALALVDDIVTSLAGSPLQEVFLSARLVRALQEGEPGLPSAPAGLTEREIQVLQLIAQGATNSDIAAQLHITVRTVTTHVSNILNKTNCDNRTAAAAFAIQHNLLDT